MGASEVMSKASGGEVGVAEGEEVSVVADVTRH